MLKRDYRNFSRYFYMTRKLSIIVLFCVVALSAVSGTASAIAKETITIASGITPLEFKSTQYGYSGTAVPTYASDWGDLIPGASWVWSEYPQSSDHLATGDTVSFWTTFNLPSFDQRIVNGTIRITVDDGYTIYINDEYAGDSGYPYSTHDDINAPGQWGWTYVRSFDITPFLHEGNNTLRIDAWNGRWGAAYASWNPAGLLFKMEIDYMPVPPPPVPEFSTLLLTSTGVIGLLLLSLKS